MRKIILLVLMLMASMMLFSETVQEFWMKIQQYRTDGKYLEVAQAIEDYWKTNQEKIDSVYVFYSVSCHYALANKKKEAFKYLEMLAKSGYSDLKSINSDADFNSIKDSKQWKKSLKAIENNYNQEINSLPKTHSLKNEILLPAPNLKGMVSVEEALYIRRSVREYKEEGISIGEVSQLLWSAYGVSKAIAPDKLRGGLKTAPSAGALYPLEIYIYIDRVAGLEKGFYYYEPNGHKIYLIKSGDFAKQLGAVCYGQDFIGTAPVSLVYSAIFERTTSKYGDRGRERYVAMDLGHSAENVYLQAEAMNMGTVGIGAFDDLSLKKLVNMTQVEEPLYVMPCGKKK